MKQKDVQALIDAKIAGQGNQVDIGGALAEILTELNKGAKPVEVADITAIDGEILDALQCGDKVAKITGVQRHLYTVSYKGEGVGEGICLTYVAAGLVETVSYDFTEDGWQYNSTDKSTLNID